VSSDPGDIIPLMALTPEEVEHIAALARLELTAEEKDRFRQQLSAILDYFSQLQALDTANIPPTASVMVAGSAPRPDRSRPGLSLDDLLSNAPQVSDDQFRVPPVLD
jgi:aspartyl-tRNA(Asn)/glutamyl-tRNA(Gln) amidotransferase subunit C